VRGCLGSPHTASARDPEPVAYVSFLLGVSEYASASVLYVYSLLLLVIKLSV